MKKQLMILATVGIAVCCLGACKKTDNGDESGEWGALNAMLGMNYSQMELTVTDTIDEDTALESKYSITYSDTQITVKYSVEKFVELSIDNPSAETKTTLTGVAVIINGFVSVAGDDVGITADIAHPKLTFKESYFTNVELTGNYLFADVKNVSGFLGSKLNCSDMKVKATFLDVFYEIQIAYISESGSTVEYSYEFHI